MKTFPTYLRFDILFLLLLATVFARAANTDTTTAEAKERAKLDQEISAAANCYSALQEKPETAVPAWVISQAKGVLILTRWSGAVGLGGTGGSGIGMKKNANGTFSAPAFYNVAGASVGLQVGAGKTETVAFLMSDKALQTLTENKFVWSGNLRAVAGTSSSTSSTVDNTVDVILYQAASGLDVGAMVAATQVSVDNEDNRKFYSNASLTPADIFAGKVTTPPSAKPLLAALSRPNTPTDKPAMAPIRSSQPPTAADGSPSPSAPATGEPGTGSFPRS